MQQTIAILEDDADIRDLIEEILTEAGYRILMLSEGSTAFARIHQERPDAIILDIQLKGREDGWTVLDLLRLDRVTAHIPVLICSGDQRFLRNHMLDLQAAGCCILEKPFSIDDLLDLIRQALSGSVCRGV
jgi:DNA-binding response OmpR family regulator